MTGTRTLLALTTLVAIACGGTQTAKPTPPGDHADAGAGAGAAVSEAGAVAAGPDAGAVLTGADCNRLIDHVLQIAVIAHNKKEKPQYQPTKQQVAAIRAKLRKELGPMCLRFGRAKFDCVMAATDRASYAACDQT